MRGTSKPAQASETTHGAITSLRRNFLFAAFALFSGGVPLVPAAAESRFTTPSDSLSTNGEGVVTLAWEATAAIPGSHFELQQSELPDFAGDSTKTRYLGPDQGSVLTGFREGLYHFRVRTAGGSWSEPVAVEISYMPARQVVLLLSVGILVFVATVGTLLCGHFRKLPAD